MVCTYSIFVVRKCVRNFQIIVRNLKYEVKLSSSESMWMKFWANRLYPDRKGKTVKSYLSVCVCVCVCVCLQYFLKPEPPVPLFSFNAMYSGDWQRAQLPRSIPVEIGLLL